MNLLLAADIPHGTVMGNHDDTHPPDYARNYLTYFIRWALERGITRPNEVTKATLERYQRYLLHYRKKNGDWGALKSAVRRADRAFDTQPEIARMLAALGSLLATRVSVGV